MWSKCSILVFLSSVLQKKNTSAVLYLTPIPYLINNLRFVHPLLKILSACSLTSHPRSQSRGFFPPFSNITMCILTGLRTMLALWRLSMRFLLRTWHLKETDSFERFTMAVDFLCQMWAKWPRVHSQKYWEKNKLKSRYSLNLKFTCRLTCTGLLPSPCRSVEVHCVCAVGGFPLALKCRWWRAEQWL